MNMDYAKAFELLNQDIEKECNEKAEKAVHDNLYNRGYREGHSRGYKEGEQFVLSKIKTEIEELKPNNPNFKGYYEQNVALNKVLEVIDKYKAESEE